MGQREAVIASELLLDRLFWLPLGITIVGASWDAARECLCLTMEHEDWPETQSGPDSHALLPAFVMRDFEEVMQDWGDFAVWKSSHD